MAQYKINDTTLNGLADAVRSKKNGTTELPVLSVEDQYIAYNKAYPYQLPSFVKKTKIIGCCEFPNGGNISGIQGLGIAPGVFGQNDKYEIWEAEDYVVIREHDGTAKENDDRYNFDFEITLEGNAFAFVCSLNSNSPSMPYISFEAIGLDENGNEFRYTPLEMIDEINNLVVAPEEAFNITGDCSYRFSRNGWNWYINAFGNRIKTSNISSLFYCFGESNKLENIPFDLNINSSISGLNSLFYQAKIKVTPNIIGPERKPPTGDYGGVLDLSEMFRQCYYLREIPEDFFWKIVPNADYWEGAKKYRGDRDTIFNYCYSLRKLPDISMLVTNATYYGSIYYSGFGYCATLDEIINLPVVSATFTSNAFSSAFNYCYRLKDITFITNEDGTPKTANWKSQTIDLTYGVGYSGSASYIINYNSGITADKEVKDQTTYDALKNDPDWFATNIAYSRYNHDSAVRTISSLPDTSAYGTNTIKFYGIAGSATDGGAINTLTEEEIAVAAAKGWTVTLS